MKINHLFVIIGLVCFTSLRGENIFSKKNDKEYSLCDLNAIMNSYKKIIHKYKNMEQMKIVSARIISNEELRGILSKDKYLSSRRSYFENIIIHQKKMIRVFFSPNEEGTLGGYWIYFCDFDSGEIIYYYGIK